MLMEKKEAILERIAARVLIVDLGHLIKGIPSPCHIWQGSDSGTGRGGGYGRMSLYGCTTAVHIVMWRLHNGPIKPKMQIDHECNNRLCCNILHLKQVTNQTNQRLRAKRAKERNNVVCQAA